MALRAASTESEGAGESPESELTIHSVWPVSLMEPVVEAFRSRYPETRVSFSKWSSPSLADTLVEEFKHSKVSGDVAILISSYMQRLKGEGVLKRHAPQRHEFPDKFVPDPEFYVQPGIRLLPYSLVYNKRLLKEIPSNIFDVFDNPGRWRGKFVMPNPRNHNAPAEWLLNMRDSFDSEKGWTEFLGRIRDLRPDFVTGAVPAAQSVLSGEAAIGLSVITYARSLPSAAALGYVWSDRILADMSSPALLNDAPNPISAAAMVDFLLSHECSRIIEKCGEVSTLTEMPLDASGGRRPNIVPMKHFDDEDLKRWRTFFGEFFGIQ